MCEKNKKVVTPVRAPAVAGSFYEANPQKLQEEITQFLSHAKQFASKETKAIIVPHAGYVFSGSTAATAYKTLHKEYKNIFLIGASHHINFDGISIYNQGDYKTPLGKVKVNQKIVNNLIAHNSHITYKNEAHDKEHTLEVQLPFLQTIYKNDVTIVPIIIASSELNTIISLSKSLAPYFNDDENLFVISTDLSHYPSYSDAKIVDMRLLNAMLLNNPQELITAIVKNENTKIANLQTSACGWSSLLTLLYLTQNKPYDYELLEYSNSGDSSYGDKEKVVGYGAMRVSKNSSDFFLNDQEKKELKELAKLSLYEAVIKNKKITINPEKVSAKLKQKLGAFVTLHLNTKLKGCIGRFEPNQKLYEVVIDMAIAASRNDTRFTPVTQDELENIDIEISVLTPRKKISSINDIAIGKNGIYVEYGSKNGTYLPQVATDMNWSKEEFVNSCCRDKALMTPNESKNAQLYTYEAIVF